MLLVIIVDVPASQKSLDDVIFSVLGLAKAYLMLDRRNELRVYAASSAPLFGGSSSDEDARDPAVLFTSKTLLGEQWAAADRRENFHALYLENVKRLVEPILAAKRAEDVAAAAMSDDDSPAMPPPPPQEPQGTRGTSGRRASPIAAALTKALCFVKRWQEVGGDDDPVRIAVLQTSPDVDNHYQPVQNCIFAACSMGVTIDCCIVPQAGGGGAGGMASSSSSSSPSFSSSASSASSGPAAAGTGLFLEQAAYRTRGVLVRADPSAMDLRQHLVMAFLPSVADRAALRMPGTSTVDMSANCFCHSKPVKETAWVCSVCLSIFCEPAAKCPACGTDIDV